MNWVVVAVFAVVYVGMILGRLPRLALDRTGIALLGAIALVATGVVTPEEAASAVDVATISLLFGLMVVSAQLRLGGFYSEITRRLATVEASPAVLLGLVVATAGILSAVLANDIVCLAMTPLLVAGCLRRGLDPVPHLLGLACAANVGSAAPNAMGARFAHSVFLGTQTENHRMYEPGARSVLAPVPER